MTECGTGNLDRIFQVKKLLDRLMVSCKMQMQDDNGMTASLKNNCGTWLCTVKHPVMQFEVTGLDTTMEGAIHSAWWCACGSLGL